MLIAGEKTKNVCTMHVRKSGSSLPHLDVMVELYCSTKTQGPGLVVQQARSRYISTEFATWCKKPN